MAVALESGMSKAAVCRTFGIKRATLYDTLARSGTMARHAGAVIGADAWLPSMANEAFLGCLSKAALNEAATIPEHPMSWYLTHLSIAGGVSLVLLFGALALFSRLEDNFAEEI